MSLSPDYVDSVWREYHTATRYLSRLYAVANTFMVFCGGALYLLGNCYHCASLYGWLVFATLGFFGLFAVMSVVIFELIKKKYVIYKNSSMVLDVKITAAHYYQIPMNVLGLVMMVLVPFGNYFIMVIVTSIVIIFATQTEEELEKLVRENLREPLKVQV